MPNVRTAMKAVILDNTKFLILKQKISGQDLWDLPGGKMEYGENPYETLKREVKEETNLVIEVIKPLGIWWFIRDDNKDQIVCTTFLCKSRNKNAPVKHNTGDKIEGFRWVEKEEFLKKEYPVFDESLKKLISDSL